MAIITIGQLPRSYLQSVLKLQIATTMLSEEVDLPDPGQPRIEAHEGSSSPTTSKRKRSSQWLKLFHSSEVWAKCHLRLQSSKTWRNTIITQNMSMSTQLGIMRTVGSDWNRRSKTAIKLKRQSQPQSTLPASCATSNTEKVSIKTTFEEKGMLRVSEQTHTFTGTSTIS